MVKLKTTILALIFLGALLASISVTSWNYDGAKQPTYEPVREANRMPESGIGNVGLELFTAYVFPFEVLGLVLLAALVGAIYVARKEIT